MLGGHIADSLAPVKMVGPVHTLLEFSSRLAEKLCLPRTVADGVLCRSTKPKAQQVVSSGLSRDIRVGHSSQVRTLGNIISSTSALKHV
jgi:hypothetical protein